MRPPSPTSQSARPRGGLRRTELDTTVGVSASFADVGMSDMPADGTMRAELKADGFTIMASDAMPGAENTRGGTRVSARSWATSSS